jgi:2-(1,2-epoxy-1,2-dihydrophenyl)acetyl-CoA isomerase
METGNFRGFEVKVEGPGIAWITFNTPERLNGMTSGMKRDLIETLHQAQMDNRVRVIIFTGTGRAFCAGDDLNGYAEGMQSEPGLVPPIPPGHDSGIGTYDGLRMISQELNRTLRAVDKPTIAALNGVAIQTGFSLALACDFRIAGESARMGSATLRFALLPDEGGQHLLVQHLGLAKTLDFLMRKRIVPAREALELGLVNEVVADDQLTQAAGDLARELADGPQVAMRLLKRSIYNAAELTFEQACDEIAGKTAVVDYHPDSRDGVAAFKEKRAPKFNAWLEEDQASG